MVQVLISKQDGVFDEDGTGSQDEGREQVDVDVVSGAVELSVGGGEGMSESKKITYLYDLIILLKHHSHRVISLLQIVEKKIHQNQKKDILMKNLKFVALFT